MRNLKRALSLTLASVMLLGMMVLGTSAASYPDVTEEHNVEAIEVLQAVGVMSGSDSGNFNPDSKVSRIEMAIVMSNLLNLKVDYFENQCKFTDVPAWAGKYVAACEANGIVSGIGNNQFGTGDVTATQAALMMLKALGYFQYASDFGSNWAQETAKIAANLSLFKGIDTYDTDTLTRNQVAQLALNALKTPVVEAVDGTTNITTTVGGATTQVVTGSVNYKVTASGDAYAKAISAVEASDQTTVNGIAGAVIELGEKLYDGKLQLRENGVNDAVVYDDFGRPARRWQYDGTTFGTYAKKEDLRKEYTTKVTGKDLYDLLGADLIKQYAINVSVDGEYTRPILGDAYFTEASMIRTNTDKVGETGNGVLTQVYVDSVHHIVDIAIINTYLAKATQDYNTRDNDVDLRVYMIDGLGRDSKQYVKTEDKEEVLTVNGEDFAIEDVKENDFFLVTVADGEIQTMAAPEIISETTLNSFKEGDWVKNDDVQYDYASTAQYDDEVLDEYDRSNMQSVTYDVILDQYGYLIGIELNEELNQYLFLAGMDLGSSNLSTKNAEANVIFLDGTMATINVKVDKSQRAEQKSVQRTNNGVTTTETYTVTGGVDDISTITGVAGLAKMSQINTWCTYTVDADGVYTLKEVGNRSNARADGYKGAKKIAQSVMDVASMGITPISGNLEISSKSVALDGSRFVNDGTSLKDTGDFRNVYGNDETVYINASMKNVTTRNGGLRAIIDKVDSATTGVKNVDLTVKNMTNGGNTDLTVPDNEVYVLYKDNGYAIGVVTLGAEDNGTTNNWAYITGNVNREDLVGNNQWRWSKNAIIDGKKVVLTEVDDTMDNLDNGKTARGSWYSVRFDKDGNVTSLKQETTGFDYINFDVTNNDKFVTTVNDVYNATNGIDPDSAGSHPGFSKESSVLLYANYTCSASGISHPVANGAGASQGIRELKFENGTLYTNRSASEGFQVMPDANIVLITSKGHGTDVWDSITDGYVGWDGMEDALKDLDSETSNGYSSFDGILTAVFKDGRATSVILHDQSGNGRNKVEEPVQNMKVTVTKIGNDNTPLGTEIIYWDGKAPLAATDPTGWTTSETWATSNFDEGGEGAVTFTYTRTSTGTKSLRVSYRGDVGDGQEATQVGIQNITLTLDEAGFYDLTDEYAGFKVPKGYKLSTTQANLPLLVDKDTPSLLPIAVVAVPTEYAEDTAAVTDILGQDTADGHDWKPLAPAVTTGLTQTVTQTGDKAVKIALSGNLKSATTQVTDAATLKAALGCYSNAAHEETAAFEELYALKSGTWGFVVFQIDEDHVYEFLVGKVADSHASVTVSSGTQGIVLRNSGNGNVTFKESGAVTIDGVAYTFDVSGLTYPA